MNNCNDPRKFLEENIHLVDDVLSSLCRRNRLFNEEAEDFSSLFKCRLVEDDYRLVRAFQGRSSFKTYLYTVASRTFLDNLRKSKKRWRPSEQAKKMGDYAICLEELLYKDGLTFDEAYLTLKTNHHYTLDKAEALSIFESLKVKKPVQEVRHDENNFSGVPVLHTNPENVVIDNESMEIRGKLEEIVETLLADIDGEEKLIIKMRFHDSFTVSDIARTLNMKRAVVDRKIQSTLARFKEHMLKNGLNLSDTIDVINAAGS